jgi:hypothetical protein
MNPLLFIAMILGSVNIAPSYTDNLNVLYSLSATAPTGKAIIGWELLCGDNGPFDVGGTLPVTVGDGNLKAGLGSTSTALVCEYPSAGTYTATWGVRISDGSTISANYTITVTE